MDQTKRDIRFHMVPPIVSTQSAPTGFPQLGFSSIIDIMQENQKQKLFKYNEKSQEILHSS